MYPTTSYDPSSAIGGLLMAGGGVFLIWLGLVLVGLLIGYLIIRTAVRDGMTLALKRAGYIDPSGSRVPAHPVAPAQTYGTPNYPGANHS